MAIAVGQQFGVRDFIVNENSIRRAKGPSAPGTSAPGTSAPGNQGTRLVAWRERQLHLSVVQFLTLSWDPQIIPNPICVISGTIPSLDLIVKMFPTMTFELYDPEATPLPADPRLTIYEAALTSELADQYANRSDVLLISFPPDPDYSSRLAAQLARRGLLKFDAAGEPLGDRSLIEESRREAQTEIEALIWAQLQAQEVLVLQINPEEALLKFRLPTPELGQDRIVSYLRGSIYWPIWADETSTGTYLHPIRNRAGVYEPSDWSTLEYAEWVAHQQLVVRTNNFYLNPLTQTSNPINSPELLNDFDSTAEAVIYKLYLQKIGIKKRRQVSTQIIQLSRLLTLALNQYRSGDGIPSLSDKRGTEIGSAFDPFRPKQEIRGLTPLLPLQRLGTVPKLATGSITVPKLPAAGGSVSKVPSLVGPVTVPKLPTGPVTVPKFPTGPVTVPKLPTGPVTVPKLPTGPTTVPKLATGPMTVPKLPTVGGPVPAPPSSSATPTLPILTSLRSPGVVKPLTVPPVMSGMNSPGGVKPIPLTPIVTPIKSPGVVKPITLPPVTAPIKSPGVVKPIPLTPIVTPIKSPGVVKPIVLPPVTAPIKSPGVVKPIVLPPVTAPIKSPGVVKPITLPPVTSAVKSPGTVKPLALPPVPTPIKSPSGVKPIALPSLSAASPKPIALPSLPAPKAPTRSILPPPPPKAGQR